MANETLRLIGSGVDASQDAASEDLNLRAVWRAVIRRKLAFIAPIVLITLGVFLWAKQQPPMYTAEALLHVQNRDAQVVAIDGVVEELIADPATIESEIEFMRSPIFIRRTVQKLDLIDDPEFAPWLMHEELGPVDRLLELIDPMRYIPEYWWTIPESWWTIPQYWWTVLLGGDSGEEVAPLIDPAMRQLNTITGIVADRLTIEQVGVSYVIALRFLSEDPVKAARIVNAMAEEYLVSQMETKYAAADRATHWLRNRIDELRGQVLEAEAKTVEYRTKNNLVNTQTDNPLTLQFFQLNTQLALAQAQRAEAEARLSQARSVLDSKGIGAAGLVLGSPLMDSLRQREAELTRELADLSSVYGEKHPQMLAKRSEVQSVRDKMQDEVRRIVQDLQNEVSVAGAREQELQSSMARLQAEAARTDLAGVELGALKNEVETNRQLFQTFLARYREIVEQQGLQDADATILSPADPPNLPSHPRVMLLTVIAFTASIVLGVLLVFLVERWDTDYGFRSADEIQAALGVRALALVPDLSRREIHGIAAEDYILEKPNSAFAEALQRIRTSLFLTHSEHPPKTILITSSMPFEGKSTIAASLARQSARSGLKVILIDADLRRPRLHELIGVPNQSGLSEVLTGRAKPQTAIRRDEKSGLDFLSAGAGVVSPPDLFRSGAMKMLLEKASAYYDLVIIDSPPVAAVSDSFTLSDLVDKSIYVIRWERTPRNVALAAIRQMLEAGADIAGVILARVDIKKHARYGYADSGSYQGSYSKYYAN
jgi:polysaccharide biosynthesis transport protein